MEYTISDKGIGPPLSYICISSASVYQSFRVGESVQSTINGNIRSTFGPVKNIA
ncbi:MAG: hypothetical protein IPK08_19920 [Bacteroidetes bacterium]|nr:hypothetical protein [Bacteroidota bacterium]